MGGLFRSTVAAAAVTWTCIASVALGDVTIEHKMSVEGVGPMAAGNMSGTTKTTISGGRSRTDTDIQMQSRIVRMLAHRALGPSAEIVNLDQDKIDHLDMTRKQYTETTFEDMKARLQKAMDKAQGDDKEAGDNQPKPMDDSKCEWLPPQVDVRRPGDKANIAGYDSERLTIVASQPCKDKDSGAICEVALALDEWLAPGFTSSAEAEKFHRAYAQKLGFDLSSGRGSFASGDVSQRAQAMFGRYSGIWSEIAAKTKDVKGYPVRMSFAFAFGGPQCKSSQSQQSAAAGGDADNTPGGVAGQIGSKLGSLFHKKKDAAQTPATDPAAASAQPIALPDGLIPLITMSSEVLSVSTDGVSPAVFEVPSDFKKVDKN